MLQQSSTIDRSFVKLRYNSTDLDIKSGCSGQDSSTLGVAGTDRHQDISWSADQDLGVNQAMKINIDEFGIKPGAYVLNETVRV